MLKPPKNKNRLSQYVQSRDARMQKRMQLRIQLLYQSYKSFYQPIVEECGNILVQVNSEGYEERNGEVEINAIIENNGKYGLLEDLRNILENNTHLIVRIEGAKDTILDANQAWFFLSNVVKKARYATGGKSFILFEKDFLNVKNENDL